MTINEKHIITTKRSLPDTNHCPDCGLALMSTDFDAEIRGFVCPRCTAQAADMKADRRPRRKPLMETTFGDGTAFVPVRDQGRCSRCSDAFSVFQHWYLPTECDGPVCAACLETLQFQTERYWQQLADWCDAQEQGLLDADTREPSAPMVNIPF